MTPPPIPATYPTLLDLPAPHLPTYPREAFVAEKFQAMMQHGRLTTRLKDFWDVATLARAFPFDGETLREALVATLGNRGTRPGHETPEALRPDYYQTSALIEGWQRFLDQAQPKGSIPRDFGAVGETIMAFLLPLWDSIVARA